MILPLAKAFLSPSPQEAIVLCVAEEGGGYGDIREHLGHTRSATSQICTRLKRLGWVKADGSALALTDKGRAKLDALEALCVEAVQ